MNRAGTLPASLTSAGAVTEDPGGNHLVGRHDQGHPLSRLSGLAQTRAGHAFEGDVKTTLGKRCGS